MRALFRYLLALAALLAIWQIGSLELGEFLMPRHLDVLTYLGEAHTNGSFWLISGKRSPQAHSGNMPGPAPGGCSPP